MILFVGAVAGYVYYTRFVSPPNQNIPPLPNDSRDTLTQFKDIAFDFQIFDSASLKLLKIFGEVPVRPDTTGKLNPFANF